MSMDSESATTERVDVYLPPEVVSAVEDRLDYGDSMSGWVREATRRRLARETDCDQFEESADK